MSQNLNRNIDGVNSNYIRKESMIFPGENKKPKLTKKFTYQIPKIDIKFKEDLEENSEKEKIKEKDKVKIKEIREEEEEKKDNNVIINNENENLEIINDNSYNNQINIQKYEEKIKELEETIAKNNIEHENVIQQKKNLLDQKEKDIKQLLKINSKLKNSLELLTQRLDKVLINKSNQKHKNWNKDIEIEIDKEDLEYKLEVKEKELKNQQQLINILKKDNKNIRSILNKFGYNDNNVDLMDKINLQYKEMINMKKNFEEYKKKRFESQKNILSKKGSEEENSSKKKKNKLFLNSLSPSNKSFISVRNKNNEINIKKHEYNNVSSSFNYNKDNDNFFLFSDEEKNAIKKYFGGEESYKNFINKIKILEKSSIIKDKEMDMKIKLMENKLKEKENELNNIKNDSKKKDNIIMVLNAQNKELQKATDDLINKINNLSKTLNSLQQKNQIIMKKNQQIKNSIFNIDGIIEAKSKDGNTIPIFKEINNNKNNEINNDKSESKEKNNDITNNNINEKNV